jgi:uncharacterized membrane protein
MTEELRRGPAPRETGAENALPTQRLSQEFQNLATAVAERALASLTGKIDNLAGRLTNYVEHGGTGLISAVTGGKDGRGLLNKVTGGKGAGGLLGGLTGKLTEKLSTGEGGGLLGALTGGDGGGHPMRAALMAFAKEKIKGIFGGAGKGGKGGGKKLKVTNIVESIDVGAPLRVAYNQWTQFQDFPTFMKKVETVEQKSDEKLGWKVHIWWSHRTWESTIVEQIPDSRIIWRSQGPKGHVDGAVTFHALAPEMTRVLLVLEYHPQGFMEKTGNIWRAQGRRARLELKHFRRHVMTNVLLHPDELEGWRGEIRDSAVVKDHETAVREEQEREARERGEAPVEAAAEAPEEEREEAPEEMAEREEEGAEEAREEELEEVPEEELEEAEHKEEPEEEPEVAPLRERPREYATTGAPHRGRPTSEPVQRRASQQRRESYRAQQSHRGRPEAEEGPGAGDEGAEPARPPVRRRTAEGQAARPSRRPGEQGE